MTADRPSQYNSLDPPHERSEVLMARDVVQVRNPKTDRYVKIDRSAGRIISQKKSPGPYKNVPVAHKREEQ